VIANALLLTIALLLGYGFWLLDQLKFLAPHRTTLFHEYGTILGLSAALLFVNVFAGAFALQRKFLLKNTGRKLSHLDRQFQARQAEMPVPARDERQL
jgi:hypothetical protein